MSTSQCPDRSQLQAYAQGELLDMESNAIADHVETCVRCEATVAHIERIHGAAMHWLKNREPADPLLAEPQCAAALALVEEIGLASIASRSDVSPANRLAIEGPPSQLRDYRLLEKLGEGGMGAVYKALHTKLKRVVALKLLPADRMIDERAVARFEREMEAVGKLDHPNIVRAMDAGEFNGIHFLVMEYVDGVDLSRLVKNLGPLPIADACELIRQAAIGLEHAYEHGLVHRDIKPSNLMLAERQVRPGDRDSKLSTSTAASETIRQSPDLPAFQPTVKILDLGLALLTHEEAGHELTGSGQLMGTIDYMAPEQGGDSHVVDIRADIYALGATLFKLLTGEVVYAGPKYRTQVRKMMAKVLEPVPAIQERRPEVPSALAAIVHRLIAKDPHDRPARPAEVAALLAPFAQQSDLTTLIGRGKGQEGQRRDALSPSEALSAAISAATVSTVVSEEPRSASPAPLPGLSSSRPSRRQVAPPWLIAMSISSLAMIAILAGAVVIIRDRDGKEVSRVEVPEGGTVAVAPSDPAKAEPAKPLSPPAPVVPFDSEPFPDGTEAQKQWAMREFNRRNPVVVGKYQFNFGERDGKIVSFRINTLGRQVNSITDISMLENLAYLEGVDCRQTGVRDLTPLARLKLKSLIASDTPLENLTALVGMPLQHLDITGTAVTDLTPLLVLPIVSLNCDFNAARDAALLREIKTLKLINGRPAVEELR